MRLEDQIKISKEICQLIKSKYNDSFPTGYNTPEARYYRKLEGDIAKAEGYLSGKTEE